MLVGTKALDEKNIISLISDIRQKKELQKLSAEFVRDRLFAYLQKNPKAVTFLLGDYTVRSSKYKAIIKAVRADLRKATGLYCSDKNTGERQEQLRKLLKGAPVLPTIRKILETHASTKERLPFYGELYAKIFARTGIPKTIIDLGCGLNPFSFFYMNLPALQYYAYDVSEGEVASLKTYFSWLHKQNASVAGQAQILDLLHWAKLSKLSTADICFLFKMTDVLDRGKGHKATEAVVKSVPAKWVVVSFPTLTMSGKKMNNPRRKWIELMCQRLLYRFYIIGFNNEMFYVIQRTSEYY